MCKKLILSIGILLITSLALSQSNKKFIDTGSVKNQFDYLITKSYKYKDYKNVNINWLYKLKLNVADSLKASKNEILTSTKTINSQRKIIDSLKVSIEKNTSEINALNKQIESIYENSS